jgi:hypothetical protein
MSLTKVSYSLIEGNPINVLDYGADPTGVNDSTEAIQAAIDYAKTLVVTFDTQFRIVNSFVYIPSGVYRLNSGIEISDGILLQGASQGSVLLDYYGSGGNAIEYVKTSVLYSVQLSRFTMRNSGTGDRGISIAPTDPETGAIWSCSLEDISVTGFDTNIYAVNSWTLYAKNCIFRSAGSYNAHLINPSDQHWSRCRFNNSGIHNVFIEKAPSYGTVYPVFDTCTMSQANQWGIFGTEVASIYLVGCNIESNSESDANYGGVRLEGAGAVDHRIVACYFSTGGTGTPGQTAISIDQAQNVYIDSTIQSIDFGVGVKLGASVDHADVRGRNNAVIQLDSSADKVFQRFANVNYSIYDEPLIGRSFLSYESEINIGDDEVATLELSGTNPWGNLLISSPAADSGQGLIAYKVGTTPVCTSIAVTAAVEVTTGALTGTTGTDGKLTISTFTDNKIYIENRTGTARPYTVSIFGDLNGKIINVDEP